MPDPTPPPDGPSREVLKAALKAFKKRLKLMVLDDQSQLSRSPVTGGRGGNILAITPPAQFPPAVWEELARQKKLRGIGQGMYELVPDA